MTVTSSRDERRLYGDLAWTWPIISAPDHYVAEATAFVKAIRKHSRIGLKTLLDLGCGGGHNDFTLKKHCQVTGVDISEAMLTLARHLNPDVTYLLGDMREVRLGRTFDAVIIADSIDYMLTLDDLGAAFLTSFEHLRPGGVFCTYAQRTPHNWRQNETECSTGAQGETELVFINNRYDPDPTDTTYENVFVYLIRCGGELVIETDRHLGGIFSLDVWHSALSEVGFTVEQAELDGEGIPMFCCIKPMEAS